MGKIDARGRSCPQPVMMTKLHVEKGEQEIEIYLDNAVSASNVQRYLEKNGYRVRIFDEDGSIIIRSSMVNEEVKPAEESAPIQSSGGFSTSATASASPRVSSVASAQKTVSAVTPAPMSSQAPASEGSDSCAVLITRKTIGGDDSLLGEVLMKGFLGTLSQRTPAPSTLALMNEGVKLAMKNTASLDHLVALEKRGVQILVCGTCTNHFGITSDIGAGVISNMFEITEALLASGKILSL